MKRLFSWCVFLVVCAAAFGSSVTREGAGEQLSWKAGISRAHASYPTEIDPNKNLGSPDCNGCGNPINFASGNKYQEETDYVGPGPFPVVYKRYYNSKDDRGGISPIPWRSFGLRWRGSYERSVYMQPCCTTAGVTRNTPYPIEVVRDDGRRYYFRLTDGGVWIPDSDVNLDLSIITDSSGRISGYTIKNENDEIERYDASGRLLSVTNRVGMTHTILHSADLKYTWITDSFGRVLTIYRPIINVWQVKSLTMPDSSTVIYTYDGPTGETGDLISVKFQDGSVRRYTHGSYSDVYLNSNRYLTGVIDENGDRYATFDYDRTSFNAISTEHAGGVDKYTIDYSAFYDNIVTVTNPLGASTRYLLQSIIGSGKQAQLTRCANCTTPGGDMIVGRDANGNIRQITDFKGNNTVYEYDLERNLETKRTEGYGTPQARTITTTWHPNFRLPTQITDGTRTLALVYDAKGNLKSRTLTDPAGSSFWRYSYNSFGQVLTATDPRGRVTSYEYDNLAQLRSVTNALGHVTRIDQYDASGRPHSITDRNGVVTTLEWNFHGQITSRAVGTAATSYEYDRVGQLKKFTRPDGSYYTFIYDPAHRLKAIKDAFGNRISYARDAAGNWTRKSIYDTDNALAWTHQHTFDGLSRLVADIGGKGQEYDLEYDNNDNLAKATDPLSKVTQYSYDPLDRLSQSQDPTGAITRLDYDSADRLTSVTDPRGLITAYSRDRFGKILQQDSPDSGGTTIVRNSLGLPTKKTNARGVSTYYFYDDLARLTGKTYSGGTGYFQSFTWDAAEPNAVGRLSGLASESGSNWRKFDQLGRIILDTRTTPPAPSLTTDYGYDPADRVTQIGYPSGRSVTYSRDLMGRITGVSTRQNAAAAQQTVVWNVLWRPFGPLASLDFANNVTESFTYDRDYNVAKVQAGRGETPAAALDRSLNWSNDQLLVITDNLAPGNSTPFTYSQQSQNFAYDELGRLRWAKGYFGSFTWTYDGVGNRTSERTSGVLSTYAYAPDSNRLLSITKGTSTRAFTFDAAGNTKTDSRSGAFGMSFEYDVEGRLSKAYKTNAPTEGGVYRYDALNRLVSRAVTQSVAPLSTATHYIHDIYDRIIAETDSAGVTKREYIWLNDLPVAVIDKADTAAPVIYYVVCDHLGRPARMIGEDGAWVWDVIYSPFGAVSYIWENPAVMNLRFPGQWFQLESGLAYNWHRHYDASIGRYLQSDPIGLAGGINTYGYVGGNPLAWVDKFGLAIGDLPPPAPGYDPNTWTQGQWGNNGKDWVRDPNGNTYTLHPEDKGHWRHWDKQDKDGNDGGMCPPNSKKPWPGQKKLNEDQSTSDPNGDARPWWPGDKLPRTIIPVIPVDPVPMLPPIFEPIPIPIIP